MRLSALGEFTPRQTEILERTLGPGATPPPPFLVWAHSPELCDWVEGLGAYCRDESLFPQRLRELSVLIVGRHWDSPFAWLAHYEQAVALGVSRDSLDRLARREDPQFELQDERVFFAFAQEVLEERTVSDETYQAALRTFGERALVDLVGCLGSFSMSAMMLNTFQVDPLPGWTQPFPDLDTHGWTCPDSQPEG